MEQALESDVGIEVEVADVQVFRYHFYQSRNLYGAGRYTALSLHSPGGTHNRGKMWIKKRADDNATATVTPSNPPLEHYDDFDDEIDASALAPDMDLSND